MKPEIKTSLTAREIQELIDRSRAAGDARIVIGEIQVDFISQPTSSPAPVASQAPRRGLTYSQVEELGDCQYCQSPMIMGFYGKPYCRPCFVARKERQHGRKYQANGYDRQR